MLEQTPNYQIQTRINRPVAEVFSAIVDEHHLCNYFTEQSSGPLLEGSIVVWRWREEPGEYPVLVKYIAENREIQLELQSGEWNKTDKDHYPILVRFLFEALEDGNTLLSISETGWKVDPPGLKASHENCGGWQHMVMCLKMYLEHDLDARL